MPNKINNLMTGLTVHLKAVTLEDGSTPIDSVKKATELDEGFLKKRTDNTVLSQRAKEWDGENSALGSQEIIIDVWLKNINRDAGAHQIESNTLLESIKDAIQEQAAHFSGGPFGAGTDLILIEPPVKELPDSNLFLFKLQLVYNILWG